jgi:putative transposase
MRTPRQLREGARYHVTAHANRQEMIFDAFGIKEVFLGVVKRAKAKYDFRIENFCIMGNHFHFILWPRNGESLSAIMRWILSVFAMTYNRLFSLTGHVWRSRFFSRIIPSLGDFLRVFRYIDENPVKARCVVNSRDWHYGGLWFDRKGNREILEEVPDWIALQFPEHLPFPFR